MGLWNWVKTQYTGVDEDAEQSRAVELEAALDNEALKDKDKYGEEWYNVYKSHDAGDDVYLSGSEFDTTFQEELSKNASALGSAGDRTISTILKTIFSAVPWWVWIALVVYGLWQFGLLKSVLKKAK
jgi:hypothetical protein